MHQHRFSSSCRQEGSLQRLKSHIGSMIRHNATITQIMLQQALFGNSTNASKSSVSKITKRENESQFKCLTWVKVYANIDAPAFQKWAITSNFGWKKRWSTRYWPPGSGFISELFRSLMPTINTQPGRRMHAVVLKPKLICEKTAARKDDRNKRVTWKQWIVLLPLQGLTTTMCVVRSPRPRLACPKV